MSAFTAQFDSVVQVGGITSTSSQSYSGESMPNYGPTTIADATTDLALDIMLDVSEVTFFYALASEAMTLETNSSSSPTNTITLQAGKPYIWRTGDYNTFKLTSDVTQIYVTNASGNDGTLTIRALSTPA